MAFTRLVGIALGLGLAAASAQAQYYAGYGVRGFGPLAYGYAYDYGVPPRRVSPFLHPVEISRALQARGFTRVNVLERRGDVFVVDALSPRTGQTRLILDAFDAEILERYSPNSGQQVTGSISVRPPAVQGARPKAPVVAELPMPPRRPAAGASSAVLPSPQPEQKPVSRPASDWAPINSVPVAPLE